MTTSSFREPVATPMPSPGTTPAGDAAIPRDVARGDGLMVLRAQGAACLAAARAACEAFAHVNADVLASYGDGLRRGASALASLATARSPLEAMVMHGDLVRAALDDAVARSGRQADLFALVVKAALEPAHARGAATGGS